MPINRWIGQAVASSQVAYYVPGNVQSGDKFQLSDGIQRYGYTYPSVPPEADVTATDRARRVVDAIVEAAAAVGGGLGGGTDSELFFESANYNGSPAVKVTGLPDGQPLGIVATASTTTSSRIVVHQAREGDNGTSMVFRLIWTTIPTAGQWAISASGKNPVILNFNATAAELAAALNGFALTTGTATVTGSHSTGYLCTIPDLRSKLPNPPVLFPIVPTAGTEAKVTGTFHEHSAYVFGGFGIGYEAADIFEADITDAGMRTYLQHPTRMGSLANTDQLGIASARINPTVGYSAGSVFTFRFFTSEAYDRFIAMSKERLVFTWTVGGYTDSPGVTHRYNHPASSTFWQDSFYTKTRQKTVTRVDAFDPDVNNPFERYHHTRAFKGSSANQSFVINDPVPGYSSVLVRAKTQVIQGPAVSPVGDWSVAVNHSLVSSGFPWYFTESEIETGVGVCINDATVPWVPTINTPGVFDDLGVNNNASYTVETTEQPGIINQESRIPLLDGNFRTLYQLEWAGNRSPSFTGATSIELFKDSCQALFGASNVAVGVENDGYFCRLSFVGALSEREVTVQMFRLGDGADTGGGDTEIAVDATTPMKAWILRYRFTGGVCSGRWRFRDAAGVNGATWFKWLSPVEVTAESLHAAIVELDTDYATTLQPEDISVETEQVGRQFVLREFTITWQAQPSAPAVGGATAFWVGIDTASLKSAEPAFELVTFGTPQQSEIQIIGIENKPTGGNFVLEYNGSPSTSLAFNATAGAIQSAITALGQTVAVIGGNGGPWRVSWTPFGPRFLIGEVSNTLTRSNAPTFTTVIAVPGTGPKHWDNADNWSLTRVPIDGDDVVFSDGAVDCSYRINSTANLLSFDIYRSYGGRIGLPEIRDDGSIETLPSWLAIDYASGTPLPIRVGLGGSGEGPSVVRIEVKQRAFDTNVLRTQSGLTQSVFAIKGTAAGNKLVCVSGDIALGVRPEDTATCESVILAPSADAGDDLTFSSSAGATISLLTQMGGTSTIGKPPEKMVLYAGDASVNGAGNCNELDAANATVRWLGSGTIGKSAAASAILFGAGLATSSASPERIKVTSNAHGLQSGQRVYMRAYSGVFGIDGKVYAVSVVDANNFDLLGSLATGTLTGYAGTVHWALERAVIIRPGATLDFDSDGRARDMVSPIVVQGSGAVLDSKVSIIDLRLWPEQVESLAYLGQTVEIRRNAR